MLVAKQLQSTLVHLLYTQQYSLVYSRRPPSHTEKLSEHRAASSLPHYLRTFLKGTAPTVHAVLLLAYCRVRMSVMCVVIIYIPFELRVY